MAIFKKKKGKDTRKIAPEEKVTDFYPASVFRSWKAFPRNLIFRYNMKYNAHKRYLVEMRLRNGDETTFYAFPREGVFIWNKGGYIVDDSLSRFNMAANVYKLCYHEDLCLPVRMDYDVTVMKNMVSAPNISDMKAALNPAVLMQSQSSKVVQNMMSGAGIPEMMRRIMIITVVILVILGGFVLLWAYKSGIFQQVQGLV